MTFPGVPVPHPLGLANVVCPNTSTNVHAGHQWNCGHAQCPWRSVCTEPQHSKSASIWNYCGPDCGNVPTHCVGDAGGRWSAHGDYCKDPKCTNPRGYNQHIAIVKKADTVVKMWRALSTVITHGPPGTQHERKMQSKRFNREMVALKKELVDLCRDRVIEFIVRWTVPHMPGEE